MKKSKLLALCMAAAVTIPLLSGCGEKTNTSDNGTSKEGTKEDVTISVLFCEIATAPYKKDWKVLDWIKEETGVTFDSQVVPSSDFTTKVNMMFNSGNMPDIITHTYPSINQSLSGLLLPINKYMDKLPNLEKFIKKYGYEKDWENLKCADGNIYQLPTMMRTMKYQPHLWSIRKDIFEKNNIPIPKTMDDILEAGKKLKEIYPDSTPITNRFKATNIMDGICGAYGGIRPAGVADGVMFNPTTKQYEFVPTTQNFKDAVTMANKLYEAGVLDKEYATLDSVVYEQRISQSDTFILYDWTQNNPKYELEGKKIDPDFDLEIIYPPTGYKDSYALQASNPWGMAMCLPASLADDPKHLDEVLSYLNWGYSDEAETLLNFGKEGETYEVKDGMKQYIGTENYQKKCGLHHNSIILREDTDFHLSPLSKEQRELVKKIVKECLPEAQPISKLTEKDIDNIQVYQTSLRDYTSVMMEKFINGTEPLSNWDKYVQSCKDKGSEELVKVYNEALKKAK